MYGKFAARDGSIIGVALFIWWWAAGNSAGTGMLADLAGFVAGLTLGVAAYLLHEWGHLLAALATGSKVRINHNLGSPFMFSYDARENSLKQFVIMSLGGFAVTAAIVISFYGYLPDQLLATRIARGAAMFLLFLLVTLELPLFLFAIVSRSVPAAAAVKVQTRPTPSTATA